MKYSNPGGFCDHRVVRKLLVERLRHLSTAIKVGERSEMAFEFNLMEQAMMWVFGVAVNAATLERHKLVASGAICRYDCVSLGSFRRCTIVLRKLVVNNSPPDMIASQFIFLQMLAMNMFGEELLEHRLVERVQYARIQRGLCPTCGLAESTVQSSWVCPICEEAAQAVLDTDQRLNVEVVSTSV